MGPTRWLTAFLDLPAAVHDTAATFWCRVTGSTSSPPRGPDGEFATLVPGAGDAYLRTQRIPDRTGRIHLDLHVDDPTGTARRAVALGATIVHPMPDGWVVLRSPAGLTCCLVPVDGAATGHRPPPAPWSGHLALVDQITVDTDPADADAEVAFFAALTGWSPQRPGWNGPFRPLHRPPGQPLRIMVQRRDATEGPATAHLDLATTDRPAETERHQRLGAVLRAVHDHFTVLDDPAGLAYCITDRDPVSGLLPH